MPQPSIEVAFESEISPGLFSSFFYSVCCCTNLSLASCFSCHFHFKIGKSLRYIRPNGRTSERIAPKAIVERYSVCYCANTWMRSFGVCITLHTNTFYHQTEWGGGWGRLFCKMYSIWFHFIFHYEHDCVWASACICVFMLWHSNSIGLQCKARIISWLNKPEIYVKHMSCLTWAHTLSPILLFVHFISLSLFYPLCIYSILDTFHEFIDNGELFGL